MQIKRALELLVLGLSAVSVADAINVSPRLVRNGKAIQRRQETGDGGSDSAATNTQPPVTTPTTPSSSSSSPPNTPPPEETSTTSRSTPGPVTSTSSSSTPPDNTPTPTISTSSSRSSGNQPSQTTPPPSETKKQEPVTSTITQVITQTNADGSKSTITSAIVTTSTPGLINDGKNNSGGGISSQTRNTIIGVVVGVGGAIVLGGLAFVAFRIWGRKKHQEESDELMDYHSTGTAEKTDTSGSQIGRTPFQSTLESYHAPGQVNTASNF